MCGFGPISSRPTRAPFVLKGEGRTRALLPSEYRTQNRWSLLCTPSFLCPASSSSGECLGGSRSASGTSSYSTLTVTTVGKDSLVMTASSTASIVIPWEPKSEHQVDEGAYRVSAMHLRSCTSDAHCSHAAHHVFAIAEMAATRPGTLDHFQQNFVTPVSRHRRTHDNG